ncbi:DUF2703 domain-containing protein [Natribaculum luteum]|uniref:DUF2703 domain-containing protein n=1 Tax=Natribaculum luteum TaxID=1586232 RepID=A0ABD5P2D1_9EURY|nr:DUF2703 domain-containing protein [Natribaculum luteum]
MSALSVSDPNVTVEALSADEYAKRTLTVDFLYLDREVCSRCRGTEAALGDALERVAPLLADLGVDVAVRTVHVQSAADARRVGLEVSPTIRVDGRDLQPAYRESTCESCGDLCDCEGGVDCRIWTYDGREHTTPPVELLLEGLLRAAVGTATTQSEQSEADDRLPENLERFFAETSPDSADETDCGCGC